MQHQWKHLQGSEYICECGTKKYDSRISTTYYKDGKEYDRAPECTRINFNQGKEIFLPYGLHKNGEFIHISEIKKGKTNLVCPYCKGTLIAKKGLKKVGHFAHEQESCNPVQSNYDTLGVHEKDLSRSIYEYAIWKQTDIKTYHKKLKDELQELNKNVRAHRKTIEKVIKTIEPFTGEFRGKVTKNRKQNLTVLEQLKAFKKGGSKLPELETLRYSKWDYLKVENFRGVIKFSPAYPSDLYSYPEATFIPDFCRELYEYPTMYFDLLQRLEAVREEIKAFVGELHRFNNFSLYFLDFYNQDNTLCFSKIGITSRSMDERLEEIKQDIKAHGSYEIRVQHVIKGFLYVETYFKQKYKNETHQLGTLTEYFDLSQHDQVLSELSKLSYKDLNRVKAIKQGMEKAKMKGKTIHRKVGTEETATRFLQKPKSRIVIEHLKNGHSLREIERQTGFSINTIRKVNDLYKLKIK